MRLALYLVISLAVGYSATPVAATGVRSIPDSMTGSGALTILTLQASSTDGPTPYPKAERDWPGVGVIRVFDFMIQNRQFFWSQRPVNQRAVVFVGDSNVSGWTTLKDDFAPLRVANVGIGGDVSRGVLFRLKEDVIELNPKAVVILVGFNDLSAKEDLSAFTSNLKSIVKMLRNFNEHLPIVLCKLPPGDEPPVFGVSRADRLDLNSRLDGLSTSDPNLMMLDLYHILESSDGSFDPNNFHEDKLHISPAGYKKFHDALVPIFRRLQVE